MKIGFSLSCEEYGPSELVEQAQAAERAGFASLWISDHFHPWNDAQGQSPFVWNVIGAIAATTERIPLTTAVTCPTVRIHPAVIAQATATSAAMLEGRFRFGIGTGEALNENILGGPWPEADVRLEMLEEAVELIRRLWTGEVVSHRGRHYTVEHARIYTLPERPPPILMSGFGPKSTDVAARIADGFVTTSPSELIDRYRSAAGADRPIEGGTKVCFHADEAEARRIAHRTWPNGMLPGELAQVLPTPEHFEQATELVSEEMVASKVPCGPDLDRHVESLREYEQAGVDVLHVQQIGGNAEEFFRAYADEVLPRFEPAGAGTG